MRSASLTGLDLDLTWERLSPGRERGAGGNTRQRISLDAGQRVLLDTVDGASLSREGCTRNLALELSASFPVDDGKQAESFAYELWMVHQPPDGPPASRVWRARSIQGDRSRFRFPPEEVESPPGSIGPEEPDRVLVEIEGEVRGWLRADGEIELLLSANRMLLSPDRTSATGGAGRKAVRVRPGEAVRLVLPEPEDTAGGRRYAALLNGHSFSLVLVATGGDL